MPEFVSPLSLIRHVPDYPKPGIIYWDITPLLGNAEALRTVTSVLASRYYGLIDKIAAIEARGFIFGAALAAVLGAGFVPVRKAGKLPRRTVRSEYGLEYGTDAIEIHHDAVTKGERVLVLDDILATGGTAVTAVKLLEQLGATVVECAFVLELEGLGGRVKLKGIGQGTHSLYLIMDGKS